MKQLRKDITKELLEFYEGLENCKKVTEAEIIKEKPSAEMAFTFVLINLKQLNERICEIIDRYQEKFEKLKELIEYFESNE